MQRVLRTDFYVRPEELSPNTKVRRLRTLSVCWFSTNTNAVIDIKIPMFAQPTRPKYVSFLSVEHLKKEVPRNFIEFIIRGGVTKTLTIPLTVNLVYPDLIESILDQTVIIEQSPPVAIPLRGLLDKSAHIVIGTYLGYAAANDHYWLLLASVPGGVMLMGAAIGISQGLMNGLANAIEVAIKKGRVS